MNLSMRCFVMVGGFVVLWGLGSALRADDVFTDPKDPKLPKDFEIQGEYVGETSDGKKMGAQVIALGKGKFQAVLYPGGLPGAGWDGKNKSLMDGELHASGMATFKEAKGTKKYLAKDPKDFSATSDFPPQGQQAYKTAALKLGTMEVIVKDGTVFRLKKTTRKSESMGKEPPEGAIVLFDGKNTEHWTRGRLDKKTGFLNTDGQDILTKKKFNNYTMHIEFLLPYRPEARGQGRGNSGFYQVDHYEVQILDSFGLDGKNNECGGVYQLASPEVNMCLPPLVWQTYDVEFTNAVSEVQGDKFVKTQSAMMTVKHNGVVIHKDLQLKGKTGGARKAPEGTPGPIKLQGHGNPLQFRNVWIVEN